MNEFVCRQNIEHYRRLLTAPMDGEQRRMLLRLLAEEEAKFTSSPERAAAPAGV